MANQSSNQTILIKKSDGTTERISLAEFKLRQKKTVSSTPVVTTPVTSAPTQVEAEVKNDERSMQLDKVNNRSVQNDTAPRENKTLPPTPVFSIPKKNISAPTTDLAPSVDVSSLLEEEVPVIAADTATSHHRLEQVDEIVSKLSFTIPKEYVSRLRALVQLRLKDIRSEVETLELAQKPFAEGGLNLTQIQANEIIKACAHPAEEKVVPKVLRKGSDVSKDVGSDLPMVYLSPELPSIATPHNAFKHAAVTVSTPKEKAVQPSFEPTSIVRTTPLLETEQIKTESILPEKKKFSPPPLEEKFILNAAAKIKPMAHDIVPPSEQMGPVEEIASFTTTDFRRLSANPVEAVSRLAQKIINLKEESILLYFEALEAWKKSPLYQEYSHALMQSLNDNTPLTRMLRDKKAIQVAEINALAGLEKQLH